MQQQDAWLLHHEQDEALMERRRAPRPAPPRRRPASRAPHRCRTKLTRPLLFVRRWGFLDTLSAQSFREMFGMGERHILARLAPQGGALGEGGAAPAPALEEPRRHATGREAGFGSRGGAQIAV